MSDLRRASWRWVLVACCLLSSPSSVGGKENLSPAEQTALIAKLQETREAHDDVVVEFYQQALTKAQARHRLAQLIHTWLDLYGKLSQDRREEVLGRLQLKYFTDINWNREPFIRRYSEYLLGDKTAVTEGELILLEWLADSIYLYRYYPGYPAVTGSSPSPPPVEEGGVRRPPVEGSLR